VFTLKKTGIVSLPDEGHPQRKIICRIFRTDIHIRYVCGSAAAGNSAVFETSRAIKQCPHRNVNNH
jgi:hypothetical protein